VVFLQTIITAVLCDRISCNISQNILRIAQISIKTCKPNRAHSVN
jgi:hypothetical protein